MNREQKAATIDVLAGELQGADAIFAVDYRGLTVQDAADLRTKLREQQASFRVVKNSLTERAADQAGVEGLKGLLQGPTALTFVHGDPAIVAKTLADKARAIQLLPFKGGVMGAEELAPEQIVALSRLPSREVLYGQLVGIVASPVSGLVRSLNALISGLAVALGQVHEKRAKEEPAESAPAPAEASGPAAEETTAEEASSEAAADDGAAADEAPAESAEAEQPAEESAPAQAAEGSGEQGDEQEATEQAAEEKSDQPSDEAEADGATDDNQPEAS